MGAAKVRASISSVFLRMVTIACRGSIPRYILDAVRGAVLAMVS